MYSLLFLIKKNKNKTVGCNDKLSCITFINIPSRSLRSASERHLVSPKSLSRTFSFTVPGWWNDLPTPIRNTGSLSTYKGNNWKLISFDTTWLYPKKAKPVFLFIYSLFLLACIYLNNAWDLVLRALPLPACLSKMNRFMYSPIVSRFG